jgi:hypothetical protein
MNDVAISCTRGTGEAGRHGRRSGGSGHSEDSRCCCRVGGGDVATYGASALDMRGVLEF